MDTEINSIVEWDMREMEEEEHDYHNAT